MVAAAVGSRSLKRENVGNPGHHAQNRSIAALISADCTQKRKMVAALGEVTAPFTRADAVRKGCELFGQVAGESAIVLEQA